MPIRPWRGAPASRPTAIAASSGAQRSRQAARWPILASRPAVSATCREVATISASSMVMHLARKSDRRRGSAPESAELSACLRRRLRPRPDRMAAGSALRGRGPIVALGRVVRTLPQGENLRRQVIFSVARAARNG